MLPTRLKSVLILVCVALLVGVACAQPPDSPDRKTEVEITNKDLTPDQVISGFLTSLEQGNLSAMWQFVLGAGRNQKLPLEFEGFGQFVHIETNFLHTLVEGNQACVTFELKLQAKNQADATKPETFNSLILLLKHGDAWKIVPTSTKAVAKLGRIPWTGNPVLQLATIISEPDAWPLLRVAARTTSAVTQLAQINLAMQEYLGLNKDAFALDPTDYAKSLLPYIGAEQVFYVPGVEPPEKFSFNKNLNGVSVKKIKDPATLVMLYTGRNGQIEFPYGDNAVVTFVDGVTKVVDKNDLPNLRWQP